MGLIRTVVCVGIIGGIFAYTQTKDSLENISVPGCGVSIVNLRE